MLIAHLIVGLNKGGAEGALYRLLATDVRNRHVVISILGQSYYSDKLRSSNVEVIHLNANTFIKFIVSIFSLKSILAKLSPDVLQTWMYHADILGGIVGKCLGIPVFWGIRHAAPTFSSLGFRTWIIAKMCVFLSYYFPTAIIGCSKKSNLSHRNFGYSNKFIYIPNGFDVSIAGPDLSNPSFRAIPVVGHVARWHPIKGHDLFLNSLDLVLARGINLRVKMAGQGIIFDNKEFASKVPISCRPIIDALGIQNNIYEFFSGCDILVLSSYGEAFPNVVAEAMLSGLPCVVTDVGDAAEIVGNTGWVVSPGDPIALSNALVAALDEMADAEKWLTRKQEARKRIVDNYSIEKMQDRFSETWNSFIK